MKMLLCSGVKLGAACSENLSEENYLRWQSYRLDKFAYLLDAAVNDNASYLLLRGRLFGVGVVQEQIVSETLKHIAGHTAVRVLLFTDSDECRSLSFRKDIPENLRFFDCNGNAEYSDCVMKVLTADGKAVFDLGVLGFFNVNANDELYYDEDVCERIPCFEPVGFYDADMNPFGYAVLDCKGAVSCAFTKTDGYTYIMSEVELSEKEDYITAIEYALENVKADAFVYLRLTGTLPAERPVNVPELEGLLSGRYTCVKLVDDTVLYRAEENKPSLRGVFMRLAQEDETLSVAGRNRIIACGNAVLNGEEVPEL